MDVSKVKPVEKLSEDPLFKNRTPVDAVTPGGGGAPQAVTLRHLAGEFLTKLAEVMRLPLDLQPQPHVGTGPGQVDDNLQSRADAAQAVTSSGGSDAPGSQT